MNNRFYKKIDIRKSLLLSIQEDEEDEEEVEEEEEEEEEDCSDGDDVFDENLRFSLLIIHIIREFCHHLLVWLDLLVS